MSVRRFLLAVILLLAPSLAWAQVASPQIPYGTVYKNYNPGGIPRINWANPLTRGLAFLWVTIGGLQYELVNGFYGSVTSGDVTTLSPYGAATVFGSSSTGATFSSFPGFTTDNGAGTGNFTLFALANPQASSTLYGTLMSGGSTTAIIFYFNIDNTLANNSGKIALQLGDGTNNSTISTSGNVVDGKYHLYLAVANSGAGTTSFYIDGTSQATVGGVSVGSIKSSIIQIGNSAGGLQTPFNIAIAGGYNRGLSQAENTALNDAPLSLLVWPQDYLLSMVATKGGGFFFKAPF